MDDQVALWAHDDRDGLDYFLRAIPRAKVPTVNRINDQYTQKYGGTFYLFTIEIGECPWNPAPEYR